MYQLKQINEKHSQVKCSSNDATTLVGMICRQCHPNSNYPYIIRRVNKRSTESTWMTSTQTQSQASTRSNASIGRSGFSTFDHLLYLVLLSLCAVLIVLLTLALFVLRNLRARVKDTVTACHSDISTKCGLIEANEFELYPLPQPQLNASHRQSDTYDVYQYGTWAQKQPDTAEAMAPPPPPPPPAQTYGTAAADYSPDPNYAEPSEFADTNCCGTPVRGGPETAQTRLLSEPTANEPHRTSGVTVLVSEFFAH